MDTTDIVKKLKISLDIINKNRTPTMHIAIPYNNDWKNYNNQFIVIIKPECLPINGKNNETIIQIVIDNLIKNNITISSAYSMNGRYLTQNSIIENQYFMLNKYAHLGAGCIPPKIINKIKNKYKDINIIGAYNFLELYPEDFNEEYLEKIAHNIGSDKFGNGLYLLKLKHNGINYGILNAFHPYQKKHFCNENSNIIVLECNSDIPYWQLDEQVIGNFNPIYAKENSIRNILFSNQEALGININTMYNGVHVSPSPLEGMKALLLYSKTIDIKDTRMGSELIRLGFSNTQIQNLMRNPLIEDNDEELTLFDKVEGMDTFQIIEYLLKSKVVNIS
ncbi:hypothetical protein BV455_04048 (plasmid) [Parageobacillus caldoxylosilyticus]|uniref:hypothetical protein n=1 Tax=Saccharococcus caldoxylosilyticus TaxID=81408 RepID=UPI001C4E1349|nr:hypothetical protein [Parageobacillus caldoxylosilyticus]QXJ40671.1 hypothetical protein BV455_04048 [Parageobacillus caldoxylosilyticus]